MRGDRCQTGINLLQQLAHRRPAALRPRRQAEKSGPGWRPMLSIKSVIHKFSTFKATLSSSLFSTDDFHESTFMLIFTITGKPILQAIARNAPPSGWRLLAWVWGHSPLADSEECLRQTAFCCLEYQRIDSRGSVLVRGLGAKPHGLHLAQDE